MNKTIELSYSEQIYNDVKQYANEKGVSIEAAFIELAITALKAGDLMRGVVKDIAPEVQDQVRNVVLQALKQHDEEKVVVVAPEVVEDKPQVTTENEPEQNDNVISFEAKPEIKELVAEINKARENKGLAPLEKSLCEVLLHWGENLGDYSSFNETTGLDLAWFKSKLVELGLLEREANGAASNLIETTGIFSKHKIVDTTAA